MSSRIVKKDLQTEEWIKKAEEDEAVSQSILKSRHPFWNAICFHAQQMAEKYLKAFLVFHKEDYPKIHSIDALWRLCFKIDKGLEGIKEDAVFLATFYVATRYPGDFSDFTWKDAKKAFRSAQKIKKLILKKIKK